MVGRGADTCMADMQDRPCGRRLPKDRGCAPRGVLAGGLPLAPTAAPPVPEPRHPGWRGLRPAVRRRPRARCCIAAVLLAAAGCATLPAGAVRNIDQATSLYRSGRYAEAQHLLDQVTSQHPKARGVGEAYYVRGLCRLKQNQKEQARSDFKSALATSDRPELSGRVNAQLGHLCYLDSDYAQAVTYYERAVNDLPDEPPADEVYFRYGDSLQRTGQWKKARTVLPKVWQLFSGSRMETYARRKFAWPHDYFAIQCGAFRSVARANELAHQLRGQGLSAAVQLNAGSSSAMHTVYVGSFSRYADAERELSRVRAVVGDAIIVP